DAKKKNFYLVSLFVHKNINLKELSEKIPSKRLSFAKQETMEQMLEVKPGSVTPLAILNNNDKNILMIFDSELQNQTIGMHPMENTATVFLKFEDLYTLLLPHGNEIRIIDL
ncbi:MAG TPA: YbaK/EbsC family protein, partial [Megamonas funiformis]|nr:YbaK/EbsC family protein [Megamonas funiformis]